MTASSSAVMFDSPHGPKSVSGAQSAIGLSLPFGFGNYAAFC
jgi:hypothetical protein